ncbi:MAG: DUF3887 domain-containing protein [Candidatus Cloacimonadota bacterium]|nr:MAG: DUF3887 domain-containing protein [Candidatus Cloacimonadota bacterium]
MTVFTEYLPEYFSKYKNMKGEIMRKNSIVFLFLSCLLFILFCAKEMAITGEEREKILQYAEPVVDSILKGFNEDNYELFSMDFDETMKKHLNEKAHNKVRAQIVSKIGLYVSKDSPRVSEKPSFIAIDYKADFEKEKGVNVRVVFKKYGDKNLVSGLWFNSPKLRS